MTGATTFLSFIFLGGDDEEEWMWVGVGRKPSHTYNINECAVSFHLYQGLFISMPRERSIYAASQVTLPRANQQKNRFPLNQHNKNESNLLTDGTCFDHYSKVRLQSRD